MTIGGQSTSNFMNQLNTVLNFVKKRRKSTPSVAENFITRLHYQWTFWFLIFMYAVVWNSWYQKDVMNCVNSFNADAQIRSDYINICFTYMFTPPTMPGETRRYLFFYRYLHFAILGVAALYYLPRKFSKKFDNMRVKKLITDLYSHSGKYDNVSEKALTDRISKYITQNLGTHNVLFYNNLVSTLLALVVDVLAFFVFDYTLQGRFISYGLMSIPFNRDPIYYTDYMSQTFPPFTQCEISPLQKLVGKRTEVFGCHLTVMELYEKMFLALWLWMVVLTFMTVCYLIYLCCFFLPYFRRTLLSCTKPNCASDEDNIQDRIDTVIKTCKVGDIFLLFKVKAFVTANRYYILLCNLAEPKLEKVVVIPDNNVHTTHNMVGINNNNKQQRHPGHHPDQAYMMLQARKGNGTIRRN